MPGLAVLVLCPTGLAPPARQEAAEQSWRPIDQPAMGCIIGPNNCLLSVVLADAGRNTASKKDTHHVVHRICESRVFRPVLAFLGEPGRMHEWLAGNHQSCRIKSGWPSPGSEMTTYFLSQRRLP